jgi:hypothetical protein
MSPAPAVEATAPPTFFQIHFDPGLYTGQFEITNSSGRLGSGPFRGRSRTFLPAGVYALQVTHGTGIRFVIDDTGHVRVEGGGLSIVVSSAGPTMHFNTTKIVVDLGEYRGTYLVSGVDDTIRSEDHCFEVTRGMETSTFPDVGFALQLAPGNSLRFGTTADGCVVVNTHNLAAADAVGAKLVLRTCSLEIEPVDHRTEWRVVGAEDRRKAGARTLVLVPGLTPPGWGLGYALEIAPGKAGRFHLDAGGMPSPPNLTIEDAAGVHHAFRLIPTPAKTPPGDCA